MRKIQVLILGVETPTGQMVLKNFNEHNFQIFKVAVPTGLYPEQVRIPAYLIPLDLQDVDKMKRAFSSIQSIVACSSQYCTEKIKSAAKGANTEFIDASFSYPEAVIEACFEKFSFKAIEMKAYQQANGLGLKGHWIVAHRRAGLGIPKLENGRWGIEQDSIKTGGIIVKHRIEFNNGFWAYLFFIWTFVLRYLFPFFGDGKTYDCNSKWRFIGTTKEHGQDYSFEVSLDEVDGSHLKPDLVVNRVLEAIGVDHNDSCDWPAFSRLRGKLNKYELISK